MLHATAVYGVDGGDEFCGVDTIRDLLDRHPDLTVVLAHVGMPEYAAAIDLAEEFERMAVLPDRLLFGSDYPSIPHDYATQVRGLARLGLDDAALRAVLAGNARGLLGRRVTPRA